MKEQKILVAVDGSEYSEKVVAKTIEYAQILPVVAILVYCHKKFPTVLGEPYRNQRISTIIKEAEILVAPYEKTFRDHDISFETRLMEEPAGVVIPNIAEIEKCDLIFMGSRGLSNLEGLIVGSVTHRVLHLAVCSVLVVK